MAKHSYAQTPAEVAVAQHSSLETGLTSKQADELRNRYGENRLTSQKRRGLFLRFIDQFKDFMIIVLLVAAALSGIVAREWADAAIILIVVLLNALLGVFQEARSEAAIEALKKLATPNAQVRRDGKTITIPATQLVPGDLVLLEAGDVVPADLR
ncbi:MAG: ATPase, partial [Lactobacillus sp.]|nr:ATPase [Lactobacillus sp.]